MAKWLPCRTASSAEVVSPIDTIIIGRLAVRWVADRARKPAGPSAPFAVTIATPIARQQIAFQKVLASISLSIRGSHLHVFLHERDHPVEHVAGVRQIRRAGPAIHVDVLERDRAAGLAVVGAEALRL